jgi:integration host factor subunit alpha
MALTKNNLIDMINDTFGIPKKECYNLIESCFEIIRDELSKGNDILISGFGKWSVKEKKERKGRNPQTGEQSPSVQGKLFPSRVRGS